LELTTYDDPDAGDGPMDFDLETLTLIAENAFRKHPDIEEMVDRTVTLAWYRWGQLGEAGKLTEENWKGAVGYTIRQVRAGRTLEGATVRDVTDEAARHRHGIKVEHCGDYWGFLDERDNPAELAQAKDTLETYRAGLDGKKRRALDMMVAGADNTEVRDTLGISAGRVSQLRREFWTGLQE
jgi:hypothetical protein